MKAFAQKSGLSSRRGIDIKLEGVTLRTHLELTFIFCFFLLFSWGRGLGVRTI